MLGYLVLSGVSVTGHIENSSVRSCPFFRENAVKHCFNI